MDDNIRVAESHMSDKGYSISTHEKQQEFAKKRNWREKMSYARWSNSAWYAFYNVNGCLSLWYSMDKTIDIPYEDALDITKEELIAVYECTDAEAVEAMTYIKSYIEDYDPAEKEKYDREVTEMLAKWKETE
jgi:hypothetical protein